MVRHFRSQVWAVICGGGLTGFAFAAQDLSLPAKSSGRLFYQHHNYREAILTLKSIPLDNDARWILAESLFRTGRYVEAKQHFRQLEGAHGDNLYKRALLARIFDCDLRSRHLEMAAADLEEYKNKFKVAPAMMSYGLGKAFYDAGLLERASSLLSAVPTSSEFGIRARYIEAAMKLGKQPVKASLSAFNQISKLPPQCVEDHAVIEMAKLAAARIYADHDQADLAQDAYLRVRLDTEFGERATIELVRTLITQAELAQYKEGRFAKASEQTSERQQKNFISKALAAIDRYRKVAVIDWHKPELMTLMGQLYAKAKRYDEAQQVYDELLGHYRSITDKLDHNQVEADKIWPYFALRLSDDKVMRPPLFVLAGVPDFLLQDESELKKITMLRDDVEKSARALAELERKEKAWSLKSKVSSLQQARLEQQEIERIYQNMVLAKQKEIVTRATGLINQALAEAEYKRAEALLAQMQDLKNQLNYVRDFQVKSIDTFEEKLSQLPKGGTP